MKNHLLSELDLLNCMSEDLQLDLSIEADAIENQIKANDNAFLIEQKLEELSQTIRMKWICKNIQHTSTFMRSPLQTPTTYGGTVHDFSYERNIETTSLEDKIQTSNEQVCWNNTALAFSSGMATLSTLFNSLLSFYSPSQNNPLSMVCFADYFESKGLLEVIAREHLSITYADTGEIDFNGFDIIYIEPTRYDWKMNYFDTDQSFENTIEDKKKFTFIIIDSTLSQDNTTRDAILAKCKHQPFTVVMECSSGLKLHQFGLELCNFGYVNIYCRKDDADIIDSIKLKQYIKKVRTLNGSALSFESASVLDAPFIFNEIKTNHYIDRVFENNLKLKKNTRVGGLFKEISTAEKGSPFVVFQIENNDLDDYGYLMGVLDDQSKQAGALFYRGSSFGFRHHRYETIIPDNKVRKGLFKIAMGFRKGPSFEFILRFMRELSVLNNMRELRTRFPAITPVSFDHLD
ncbi:hypothetical protein [Shouchella lehensis]|uniref:Uncharacterized protein n=1 Tax=Shouchella lehensis TaxID=300825 RepID=A0A4Y7WF62_9BACI|nr:hypothetical protein [Shouchella lehensis]MBG9784985.1 hypothetical protein [Shouchella lehensis]TES46406.1 hypothetical protein E2L03_17060 [Shouchella lehensis]